METAYVKSADKEYVLVGGEDGCLGVLNYNAEEKKQIFKTVNKDAKDDFNMVETQFEHSDAIVSIEVYSE